MNKNYITSIGLSLFLAIATSACKKTIEETTPTIEEYQEELPYIDSEEPEEEPAEERGEEDYIIPEHGTSAEDFIPKQGDFQIEHETKGDLDGDGLDDMVIVLNDISGRFISRPLLVLLQNEDTTYRLDKMSKVVMHSHFSEENYSKRDTEDVIIQNNGFSIDSYALGFHGTINYFFTYINGELMLTDYDGTWRGAGGSVTLIFSYKDKRISRVDYNYNFETEEETTESAEAIVPVNDYKFESITPDKFITKLALDYLPEQ